MVATMTLLTVTEYLCHKWPCSICRNHNLFLSSFMTYHWVCNKSNMTSATCGVGTAYPSRAPEFSLVFSGVRVAWSLVFCVMFIDGCSSFFFWPLYCLTSIYGFWPLFMASDLYLWLLTSIYGFWPLFTASDLYLWLLTSIYSFWLPVWYLQTFLTAYKQWFWSSLHDYIILLKVIVSIVSSFYV
jgi:hypothetical protein